MAARRTVHAGHVASHVVMPRATGTPHSVPYPSASTAAPSRQFHGSPSRRVALCGSFSTQQQFIAALAASCQPQKNCELGHLSLCTFYFSISSLSARSCLLASTVNINILRSPPPAQGNKNIPSRLLLLWAPVPLPACFKAAKPLAAPGHIEERRPIRDREHSALCCSLLSSDPCHHSGQID